MGVERGTYTSVAQTEEGSIEMRAMGNGDA